MQNFIIAIAWALSFVIARIIIKGLIKEALSERAREENDRKIQNREMKIKNIQKQIDAYDQKIDELNSILDSKYCIFTRIYMPKDLKLDEDINFHLDGGNLNYYIDKYNSRAFESAFRESKNKCALYENMDHFEEFKSNIIDILRGSVRGCIALIDELNELKFKKSVRELQNSFLKNADDAPLIMIKLRKIIKYMDCWERRKFISQNNIDEDVFRGLSPIRIDEKNCISNVFHEMSFIGDNK